MAIDGVQKMRLLPPPYARSAGVMQRRDLETDALIYGSLDGILLTLDEAEALSGAEREAVWDYVKSGGSLAVMGEGKLPDEWQLLDARLENLIPQSGEMERYEIGFGLLLLAPPLPHKGSVRYQLYDSWKKTQQPWNATYSASGANAVLTRRGAVRRAGELPPHVYSDADPRHSHRTREHFSFEKNRPAA